MQKERLRNLALLLLRVPAGLWAFARGRVRHPSVGIILLASLVCTTAAWIIADRQAYGLDQSRFDRIVDLTAESMRNRIIAHQAILDGVRAFLTANPHADEDQFIDYVTSLRLEKTYPEFKGLGFQPADAKSPAFQVALDESFGDVMERAGDNSWEYTLARDEACDKAAPVRTAAVRMAAAEFRQGFVWFYPVYRATMPHARIEQRRKALIGWVHAPIDADVMLDSSQRSAHDDIDMDLFDGAQLTARHLMGDTDTLFNPKEVEAARLKTIRTFTIGGRAASLRFSSTPIFQYTTDRIWPLGILASGIVTSCLLSGIVWSLLRTRDRAKAIAKRISASAKEQTELLTTIINRIPHFIFWKDSNGRYLGGNQRLAELAGYKSPDEMVGLTDYEMPWTREQSDFYRECDRKVIASGEPMLNIEETLQSKAGDRCISTSKVPLFDGGGKVSGVIGIFSDVTERRGIEVVLRRQSKELLEAQRIAQVGSWEWDVQTDTFDWSMEMYRMFGHEPGTVPPTFTQIKEQITPATLVALEAEVAAGLSTGKPYTVEVEIPRSDSASLWIRVRGEPVADAAGVVRRIRGSAQDISERKQHEAILRRRTEELAEAQRIAQVGSWEWDLATDAFEWSEELYRMFGGDPKLAPPTFTQVKSLIGEPARGLLTATMDESLRTGMPYTAEFDIIRADGMKVWIRSKGECVRGADGRVVRMRGTAQDITERRQADEAIRASEAKFRSISTAAQDAVIMMDDKGRIAFWNDAAVAMFGYSVDEAVGRDMHTLIAPSRYSAEYARAMPHFLATGNGAVIGKLIELHGLRKDGSEFPVELSIAPVRQGEAWHAVGILRDITQRRAAEAALAESEANLRLLIDSTGEAIYGVDLEGRCTFCNTACVQMLGYESHNELLGRNMHEAVHHSHPDGSPYRIEDCPISNSRISGEPFHVDGETFFRADGSSFPVEVWSHPQNREGALVGAVVTFVDVTERRRAEHALEQSERFAKSIVNALHKSIAILDDTGKIISVNAEWERFGVSNGRPASDATEYGDHPATVNYLAVCDRAAATGDSDAAMAAEGIRAVMARRTDQFSLEYACHSPDEQRWFNLRATRFAGQGPVRVVVAHDDVTERKLAVDALKTRVAAIHAAAEAVVVTDRSGRIEYVNPAFTVMTGYSADEAVGHTPDVLNSGQQAPEYFAELWKTILAGNVWRGELVNRRKDGSLYPEEMTITPVRGDDGEISRFVAIKRDVSAKKEQEARDRERNSLKEAVAAMEQVLGVVGHELRTPLAGLRAMSEFLMADNAKETADFDMFLHSMNDEVVKMSDTVSNLLEAARLNSGKARWNFRPMRVADACRAAVDTVAPLVDATKVAVSSSVDPIDLEMCGDPEAIRRLIVNLVANSRKHTTTGRIDVTAAARTDATGDWIDLRVADTGSGIPPEILARLGEAFALNSGVVGAHHVSGTGLGIAICNAIVAAHGGSLKVQSKVGEGTVITASLRADLTAPQISTSNPSSVPQVVGGATTSSKERAFWQPS